MPKVSHTYAGPLFVAGTTIAPGDDVDIDASAFDAWANGRAAAKWLADGVVVVAKAKRGRKPKAEVSEEPGGEGADSDTGGED